MKQEVPVMPEKAGIQSPAFSGATSPNIIVPHQ